MTHVVAIVAALILIALTANAAPPAPLAPYPSPRQLAWHGHEFYAFVHFNMNTFTDREWGDGAESPDTFAPTELDCRQWARVCKDAGMTGIILTAKHHDGFCLWPSAYTEHDVESSAWRDGQGDVLRELADACEAFGLNFGVYLSPWDQNHPSYGDSPKYNAAFVGQLEEVLTNYGDVFEVWFDGACGEGPNGKRQVYDWDAFVGAVRRLQPDAVIFSDAGPDVRWVGNERGIAGDTCWAMLDRDEFHPGIIGRNDDLNAGQEDGSHWVPAECNTSIRPGWYYHASQDDAVKSLDHLLEIWHASRGRGCNLLLNLPVDRRGLVHENDVEALMALRRAVDTIYADDLAAGQPAVASRERGGGWYAARNVTDGDPTTYWATDDGDITGAVVVSLGGMHAINRVVIAEHIELGQRVRRFRIDVPLDGAWVTIGSGTTVGEQRIVQTETVVTDQVAIIIEDARACPAIERVGVYCAPPHVTIDAASDAFLDRTEVTLTSDVPGAAIHYTLDGSVPTATSPPATGPISLTATTTVRAIAIAGGRMSLVPAARTLTCWRSDELVPATQFFVAPKPGIAWTSFEGGWQSLDDMPHAEPVDSGIAEAMTLDVRPRDEHFALRFEGVVTVPSDGVYTFFAASDDGSRVWIDDRLVVDNDGLHGMLERSGAIGLQAGHHRTKVEYFNATGGLGFDVSISGPDLERQLIPASMLSH